MDWLTESKPDKELEKLIPNAARTIDFNGADSDMYGSEYVREAIKRIKHHLVITDQSVAMMLNVTTSSVKSWTSYTDPTYPTMLNKRMIIAVDLLLTHEEDAKFLYQIVNKYENAGIRAIGALAYMIMPYIDNYYEWTKMSFHTNSYISIKAIIEMLQLTVNVDVTSNKVEVFSNTKMILGGRGTGSIADNARDDFYNSPFTEGSRLRILRED